MYEVLVAWETMDTDGRADETADFARIWHATDKVVYSRTLDTVRSARTRLERDFDPAAVEEMKATTERDLAIGGPHLAAEALRAGLVDEINLLLSPVVMGGGTAALPDDVRLDLELDAERRFGNGVVHLGYRVRR
jgi:riboflavin biosynthesis pyrimidine reductase